MDGALYEIYSDPLVEHLHELGLSTLVWETGKKCFPRYSRSAWISRRMIAECAKLSLCQSFQEDPKPAWAADYLTLACEIMGRPVAWSEITMIIGSVTQEALIFERWLRKSGARCLFVVCWYGPQAMAAIMAARRCGIKTVDLQHGIQGGVWPSWIRSPHNGYEVMPEIFWCWGGATVDELKLHSPAFSTHSAFVAGGNLWLNRWCNSTHSAEPYPISVDEESVRRKTILVSLSFDVEPLLLEAIEVSPDSWVWLIRFHPSRKKLERDQDEKLFMNTGHSGLDLKRANSSLLYELLDDVDVHVTGHSVCAVEALAFGVPSIIISELGREYFSSYIDHGLMMAVGEKSELVNEIKQVRRTAPKEIPSIARLFSSDSDAREALRSIFVNLRS